MHYVYLIQSLPHPTHRYIGQTHDLRSRLSAHNSGKVFSTAPHKPWSLVTFIALSTPILATRLERYLKSGSGHAFARHHLW
ncbi:MAG: GIY-YIG nuclease family protein [Terriglobales bacterium]